jgi:hypothetical protein
MTLVLGDPTIQKDGTWLSCRAHVDLGSVDS